MSTDDAKLLDGLTEPQRQAVMHVDGPLLVLAGPGSGKTTVVTRRVAYLLRQGIPPWQILALTFTNKAAGEMRERIDSMLPDNSGGGGGGGGRGRGLTVTTFHSFCARLLRRYAVQAALSPTYTIYDSADQRDAMKRALQEVGLSSSNWTPASVLASVSNAKNRLEDAAAFAKDASDFYARSVAKAYTAYQRILTSADAVDFDDLLLKSAALLRGNEAVRRELQERYQYLLIDEYQDTNHAQFMIAHTLAAGHGNIAVVGDPDQSIYGWRGADIRNILEFEEHYPSATIVPLGQNFRSTGHIVATADTLIRQNRHRKDKQLHTELGDGEKPQLVICQDEHHEADVIVDHFKRAREQDDLPWKGMAVLYRTNALSRMLEDACRREHIPYVIARGTAFYQRKEIKDALAYLRVAANPHDEVSLRRIINTPTRGIGATTMKRLDVWAAHHQLRLIDAMRNAQQIDGLTSRAQKAVTKFVTMIDGWAASPEATSFMGAPQTPDLAALVERVVRESGLEAAYKKSRSEEDQERLENLSELVSAAAEFVPPPPEDGGAEGDGDRSGTSGDGEGDDAQTSPALTLPGVLSAFLESVALVSDADAIDPTSGAVTLLTLHAAKGLEFEVVALAGLEEGLPPHMRSVHDEHAIEEERRLCFVGVTRAKRRLVMTRAAIRTHRGLRERTIESQFIRELPGDHVETLDMAGIDDALRGGHEMDGGYGQPFRRAGGSSSGGMSGSGVTSGGGGISVGVLVRHPTFGLGRVEAVMRRPAGSSARIHFANAGVKTLILEHANLEEVDPATFDV